MSHRSVRRFAIAACVITLFLVSSVHSATVRRDNTAPIQPLNPPTTAPNSRKYDNLYVAWFGIGLEAIEVCKLASHALSVAHASSIAVRRVHLSDYLFRKTLVSDVGSQDRY